MTTHRVVIDCDSRRITAYTRDDIGVTFQGEKHDALPQTVHDSKWSGQLMGWLASLTLEDEGRRDLGLPRGKKSEAIEGELTASIALAEPMIPPTPPSGKKLNTKELSMKANAAHIAGGVKELLLIDPP